MLDYDSVETFSPHPQFLHPQPFIVLFPTLFIILCNGLAILDLFVCSQPLYCSHLPCHLQPLPPPPFHTIIFLLVGCLIPILLQQFITLSSDKKLLNPLIGV